MTSSYFKMKKGQIWVETVIYTLIGLVLIGVVLAVVTPKINEYKDRALIEQTMEAMNVVDSKIGEVVREGVGNKRVVDFRVRRGSLYFDLDNDEIIFELNDSKVVYSEPGKEVSIGRISVLTTEGSSKYNIQLKMKYNSDLRMNRRGETGISTGSEKFTTASTPYRFYFEHFGFTEFNQEEKSREIVIIEEAKG